MIAHGRRHFGRSLIVSPDQPDWERDLVSCCHCQRMIHVVPGTKSMVYLIFNPATWQWESTAGAICFRCMLPVCLPCHEKGTCTPWEQQMEIVEKAFRQQHVRI